MLEDQVAEIEALLAKLAAPVPKPTWVIDCETTGLYRDDRVVAFAAVELLQGAVTGRYVYLVFNPGRKSHPKALEVHGWADDVLARQDAFSMHSGLIASTVGGAGLVVGHNVEFDLEFLRREFERAGVQCASVPSYCTMVAYRDLFPNRKARLDLCLREIGLTRRGRQHGALEDAFLAAALYTWLEFNKTKFAFPVEWPRPSNLRR